MTDHPRAEEIDLAIPPELDRRQPAIKSGRRPKPADTPDDVIRDGQAAWKRRKTAEGPRAWDDWRNAIGPAFLELRERAKRAARNTNILSRPYRDQFSLLLEMYEFNDIHKSVRADLLNMMEHLDNVEIWRDALPEKERDSLNHPTTVMRAYREWKCPARGNRGKPRDKAGGKRPVEAKRRDVMDEASRQGIFKVRCGQIIGLASIEDWSERPDQGLLDLAREAGTKLLDFADRFEDARTEALRDQCAEARTGAA